MREPFKRQADIVNIAETPKVVLHGLLFFLTGNWKTENTELPSSQGMLQ